VYFCGTPYTTCLRALLCLLLFFVLGGSLSGQEQTEIVPRSDKAGEAFLQPRPGRRIPLQLNRPNQVEKEYLEMPGAKVVFTREGYLDRLVPVEPTFLESGFPGDFTNLQRYYELNLESTPRELKVYEIARSSDQPDRKSYLGTTGGVPIRIDRGAYYDSARGRFHEVRLLLEQAGYQPYTLEISAKELVPTKQFGAIELEAEPGLGGLWKRSPALVLMVGFLLSTGLLMGIVLLKKGGRVSTGEVDRIGQYDCLEQIGKGGTAEVYRARAEDGLQVALKVMPESALDTESLERFKREIQASLRFEQANLAQVYDWGQTHDGRLYLVSELLEGETLSQRLKREEVGPQRDLLIPEVLEGVAGALSYLHDKGVVHRDVKPANIFITRAGVPKLIDLGLARGADLDSLTRTGTAVGTPYYMSPEQAGGSFTPQSDQYALGVIAFEIVTGQRPFSGTDPLEVFQKHISAPLPSVAELRPDAGVHLAAVIAKMLSKKPEQRFPTLSEALEALTAEFRNSDGDDDTQAVLL